MDLEPETSIDRAADHMMARSGDAWLRVSPASGFASRRWVRLRYSSSYFDDPVRPLIRFVTADGAQYLQPMNGPVLGSGEWIGRIPDKTVGISLSPVATPGVFDFRLDAVQNVWRSWLVWRGLSYDRDSLLLSVGAKIINAQQERWDTLKFAGSATALDAYADWHRRLYRPIDIRGLDRPRSDWSKAPAVRLFMTLAGGGVAALQSTLASLRAQVYAHWSLHAIATAGTPVELLADYRRAMSADARLQEAVPDTEWSRLASDFAGHDAVAIVSLGDVIPDHAFAVIAERLAAAPELRIVYGDEDSITDDGTLHSPVFKPDWSRVLFDNAPYLGRLTCLRHADVLQSGVRTVGAFFRDEDTILKALLASARQNEIGHIRRILYRRRRAVGAARVADKVAPAAQPAVTAEQPEVSIVIPTRNRATLLSQCLDSLRKLTDYPRYNVVIVDNGSTEADAVALLRDLASKPNVSVVTSPGPFNFSALCNTGAAATAAPVIVFLNNDTVIFDPNWLAALVKYAVRPDVGFVGAKLLFPDNRIEHAGVVLGHGGIAGHLYERHPASEPGYMGQLLVARETAAVTGACFAIARTKFEAVDGFDAVNLPVDLNDIDLCLRISEKGWATIWTPEAVLYHLQSASRGFQFKPTKVYRKEREFFLKRWPHVIRDDPFFHPALSLYSHKPALA